MLAPSWALAMRLEQGWVLELELELVLAAATPLVSSTKTLPRPHDPNIWNPRRRLVMVHA